MPQSRVMYIEKKSDGLTGPGRIGRVTFSRTGRTIYYRGQTFHSLGGRGFKANYYDTATGDGYWISGPKRDGRDHLYGGGGRTAIDDACREEYWSTVRGEPNRRTETTTGRGRKYGR